MDIKVPHNGPPMPTAESKTITILIGGNDKLFYYHGKEENAKKENRIHIITYDERTGIGKLIREKQAILIQKGIDKNELMIVIKPGEQSTYKNAVDILDEMIIDNVTRYAMARPLEWERHYLEENK